MLKKKNNFRLLIVSIFLFVPFISFADLRINEIMYDLEGSDTDREWIEIYNDGDQSVDLTDWKFNDGSNHTLNVPPKNGGTGSIVIGAGGYVVLTQKAETFIAENSSYIGTVIDTVMSLNNTGTNISLLGTYTTTASYNKDLGGNGDGNSLQINSSGNFIAATPTPGEINSEEAIESSEEENISGEEENIEEDTSAADSTFKAEPQVYADAGADKTVMVGVFSEFSGIGHGIKKEPLASAEYTWNMGDGTIKKGKKINHIYRFPGRYIVILDVSSGEYSQGDSALVTVLSPTIYLSEKKGGLGGYIEIKNTGNRDLDISGLILKTNSNVFSFPKGTIISALANIKFANETTGLFDQSGLGLFYGNGSPLIQEVATPTTNQSVSKPVSTNPSIPTPTKSSAPKEAPSSVTNNSVAAVGFSPVTNSAKTEDKSSNIWIYILGVLAISGLSVVAIMLQKKETLSLAEEYEIVEE